jgi:uncharacterized protein (TIGR02145 family)
MIIESGSVFFSQTVTIGTQIWMTENLNVDKFRNGDPIPEAKTNGEWEMASKNKQPAWCYFNNDTQYAAKYGKLYNWYAVKDPRGLAPDGYRIPSDVDWFILLDYLGKSAGKAMKSDINWGGHEGNNNSGFCALPASNRHDYGFFWVNQISNWWSSSNHPLRNNGWSILINNPSEIYIEIDRSKGFGMSVRCIKSNILLINKQIDQINYIEENCELAYKFYLNEHNDAKKNGIDAVSHYNSNVSNDRIIWPKCLINHIHDLESIESYYNLVKDTIYTVEINYPMIVKSENGFFLDGKGYSGKYYNYFENKQIKSIQEIIGGKVRGITTEFWNDKSYIFSNYQDTVLLNNTKKILGQAKYDLALCIQDTAKYNSDERNYLKNEIGGYEKLQKLINQNDQNKLNSEKKTKFEHYVKLAQLVNSSIQRLYVIKKSISELEKKINIESSKKVFIPIKSIEYYQFDTLKQGKAIIYNSSGVKISEGEYKNNLENNKWTFYSNNSIIEETDYELGQIHGVKKTYDKNGKIQSESLYKKGELHGIKKEFYENGEIYSTTEYVNGKKSGIYTVFKYNQQGKQFECYYLNDKKNGKEINYNLTGNFIYWEYSYLNDEKEGPFKEYHDNGSIKNEGTFSKNRKNGLYKEYFLNGKLKLDANFTNDKRNGKHKTFYESGQIATEINYLNDKEHGSKISYYANGKIKEKAIVDTNSLAIYHYIGDYYMYNEDGTLSNHYFAHKDGSVDIKFPIPQPTLTSSNGKSLRDPRRKDLANVYWDGEFPLYSHLVDIEITPDIDGIYKMWYATNEDKTPRELWLRKGERKNVYKFKTYEECIIWCRGY